MVVGLHQKFGLGHPRDRDFLRHRGIFRIRDHEPRAELPGSLPVLSGDRPLQLLDPDAEEAIVERLANVVPGFVLARAVVLGVFVEAERGGEQLLRGRELILAG